MTKVPDVPLAHDPLAAAPEALATLRESLRLRIDRQGRIWAQDDEVTHPRVLKLFRCSITARAGRLAIAVGPTYAFLTSDHCPLRVLHAEMCDEPGLTTVILTLDDGRSLRAILDHFAVDDHDHLIVKVESSDHLTGLWAALTNPALSELAPYLATDSSTSAWHLPSLRHDLPIRPLHRETLVNQPTSLP